MHTLKNKQVTKFMREMSILRGHLVMAQDVIDNAITIETHPYTARELRHLWCSIWQTMHRINGYLDVLNKRKLEDSESEVINNG